MKKMLVEVPALTGERGKFQISKRMVYLHVITESGETMKSGHLDGESKEVVLHEVNILYPWRSTGYIVGCTDNECVQKLISHGFRWHVCDTLFTVCRQRSPR